MGKANKSISIDEAIESQKVKSQTDHLGNGLEKSKGNEVSATGRDIPERATVPLDSHKAEEIDVGRQGVGGRSKQ